MWRSHEHFPTNCRGVSPLTMDTLNSPIILRGWSRQFSMTISLSSRNYQLKQFAPKIAWLFHFEKNNCENPVPATVTNAIGLGRLSVGRTVGCWPDVALSLPPTCLSDLCHLSTSAIAPLPRILQSDTTAI